LAGDQTGNAPEDVAIRIGALLKWRGNASLDLGLDEGCGVRNDKKL